MNQTIELIEAVPAIPAPLVPHYPQFKAVPVPSGSGAMRAYRGYIRPFCDDATARRVLRALTANEQLSVFAGRLDTEAAGLPVHPLEEFLIGMAEPCTVIVLEFAGAEHPRAYLIDPPLIRRVSGNAHLRLDLTLHIEGNCIPALCVYSGNLFKYDPLLDRLAQFLNQLSTYLARHLIFLRTRMLCKQQKNGTAQIIRRRQPGEPVNIGMLSLSKKFIWFGHWPGPVAPSGPAEHLRTVSPEDECWCNLGKLYKNCHRPDELRYVRQAAAQSASAPQWWR